MIFLRKVLEKLRRVSLELAEVAAMHCTRFAAVLEGEGVENKKKMKRTEAWTCICGLYICIVACWIRNPKFPNPDDSAGLTADGPFALRHLRLASWLGKLLGCELSFGESMKMVIWIIRICKRFDSDICICTCFLTNLYLYPNLFCPFSLSDSTIR